LGWDVRGVKSLGVVFGGCRVIFGRVRR
jgi:hypothetical protein